MEAIHIAVLCAFIILIVVLYMRYLTGEGFATIKQKTTKLSEWMKVNPRAPYVEYIRANPESNIVEYTMLRRTPANKIQDSLRV